MGRDVASQGHIFQGDQDHFQLPPQRFMMRDFNKPSRILGILKLTYLSSSKDLVGVLVHFAHYSYAKSIVREILTKLKREVKTSRKFLIKIQGKTTNQQTHI